MNEAKRGHELLPDSVKRSLPALYSTQDEDDPIAQVKFFHPLTQWTWCELANYLSGDLANYLSHLTCLETTRFRHR